jgi:D-glycero-alpha-D-manno-heptose-7-phosphate kinase
VHSADFGERAEAATAAALPARGGLALLRATLLVAREADTGEPDPTGTAGQRDGDEGADVGIELFVRCDAPPGSGTGSSAAVGVSLAGAVAACLGRPIAAHEAALRAIRAEREYLRVAGGTQDQYAAAHGGASLMTFRDPVAHVSPLRLTPAAIAELEKRLVLVYTGVSRVSGDVATNVMASYEADAPRTVAALRRLRTLAHDVKEALLRGDVDALGPALADNWRCQKDLHPSVSSTAIDALYDRAIDAGAQGGKALGAGGGGCLLFLARPDREHEVRAALAEAGAQPLDFSFEWGGLQVWRPSAT